jgi:hypothetical protein
MYARLNRPTAAAALVAVSLTLAAPTAHAIDFIDPTAALRVAILVRIATIAARIHALTDSIARATREIQERQQVMFPREALDTIGSVFQTVRSFRQDLDLITAQWTLSYDAEEFRRSLVGETTLDRSKWESLWGKPGGPQRDLDEFAAWAGERRYLSAASFLSVHDQWQDAANNLAHEARSGHDASAGRSIRLTAVAASMGLQQATVANKLAAEQLDAAQEDLDFERHEELLADALGDVFLSGFERASRPLASIYGAPKIVIRSEYETAWGTSRGPERDIGDVASWLSVTNRNTVQGRTSAAFGLAGELPESTWERIGREGSRVLAESKRDPLSALRHTPQMLADRARVESNTLRMQAQTLTTRQVQRDFRRYKKRREQALGAVWLRMLAGPYAHETPPARAAGSRS